MDICKLKNLIKVAKGEMDADLVLKNASIVDVFTNRIIKGDVAIYDNLIAGIGKYSSKNEIDLKFKFLSPGLIDAHFHIESTHISVEELAKVVIPTGTTTIIADPHEIANVLGVKGIKYIIDSAKNTKLNVLINIPSCVPATKFENSGAIIDSNTILELLNEYNKEILGLAEMMDYVSILNQDEDTLYKIIHAINNNKIIDGHSPRLSDKLLNAYSVCNIRNDHEVESISEMYEKISKGFYIMLREGTACKNLKDLLKGYNESINRRLVLCSDDRCVTTILEKGVINEHLKICVEFGIDPISSIKMATLNTAECMKIPNLGAIAPGYIANLVVFDDLKDFTANLVIVDGLVVAKDKKYLLDVKKHDIKDVRGSIKLKDFTFDKIKYNLNSNKVNTIKIISNGVVTKKDVDIINLNKENDFVFDKNNDLCKILVIERHKETKNIGRGFLKGYGIKTGAIALSIAHDSHNIIAVGTNNTDIYNAIIKLKEIEGGVVLVNNGNIVAQMSMPIAGLMSDKEAYIASSELKNVINKAYDILGVSKDIDPIMTLSFMSLPVIPDIKITDKGLFDVTSFKFISLECEN